MDVLSPIGAPQAKKPLMALRHPASCHGRQGWCADEPILREELLIRRYGGEGQQILILGHG
jgi:hypothetical protein